MKTMKKAMTILFAAILTFALLIPAHALDGTLAVTSIASARAGDTVTVTVSLQNNPGLYTALVGVTYDTAALDLVSVADCGLFGASADTMTAGGNLDMIPYRVLWMDNVGSLVSASGDLLTITFKVADDAQPGTYSFAVTCDANNTLDANIDTYDLGTANGSVTVVRMPGDADGNGQITLRDAILISRWLAGGFNITLDLSSADVNGDGIVNLMDVVLIKRYLVGGWGVTLQ
ncbi:MAG: hypothetical protein IJT44_07635 [Clostridia bacterium]|nr:hypothetical protein [Clostridia bacterium]